MNNTAIPCVNDLSLVQNTVSHKDEKPRTQG